MANEGKFRRLQCEQAVVGVVNEAIESGEVKLPKKYLVSGAVITHTMSIPSIPKVISEEQLKTSFNLDFDDGQELAVITFEFADDHWNTNFSDYGIFDDMENGDIYAYPLLSNEEEISLFEL